MESSRHPSVSGGRHPLEGSSLWPKPFTGGASEDSEYREQKAELGFHRTAHEGIQITHNRCHEWLLGQRG